MSRTLRAGWHELDERMRAKHPPTDPAKRLNALDQVASRHAESPSQFDDVAQPYVALPSLDPADAVAVQVRLLG